jgi:hypothetical protein
LVVRSDLKVRITVKGMADRPSGYRLTPGFTGSGIDHEETIGCGHAKEHALLFLHLLDVIAYDCGVRKGEFKEYAGRAAKVKQLVDELWATTPRDSSAFVGEEARVENLEKGGSEQATLFDLSPGGTA